MNADERIMRREARREIRRALGRYEDPEHVLLYAASRQLVWQELNSRAKMHPSALSQAIESVDNYLITAMRSYIYA